MKQQLEKFTNRYQLSKTLRFELVVDLSLNFL